MASYDSPLRAGSLAAVLALAACSMHCRATHWNRQVGPDGAPVFVLQSTYVGLRFVAVLPLVGQTTIDDMIAESTELIDEQEGSHLRLVETETNNYWYALPPLSWFFSPVSTSVSIEYQPSAKALAREGVVTTGDLPSEPGR